ncbi:ataxin-7-like protein 1 [Hypomesus transpacificus]|uniref:ataxin-7-like protein 1 n=1 Tax=Hypomesus transpacificus TaxID=137520 RepID=UPI001F07E475|nr:ataxin-7-like protein 1 [Hypomesus transpacificus]
MATLDRQIPSPDTFLCKPWSTFVKATKLQYFDNSPFEDSVKYLIDNKDAIKLSREEMHVYGQRPTQEDFCLVVCHVCNQVVKPQGILTHYGRRPGTHTAAPGVPLCQTASRPNTARHGRGRKGGGKQKNTA